MEDKEAKSTLTRQLTAPEQITGDVYPVRQAKGVRLGGRARGTPNKVFANAVQVALDMSFDPIVEMIRLYREGTLTAPDGRVCEIDISERCRLLREVTFYLRSRAPVEVRSDHEHRHVLDVDILLANPKLAAAAEELVLGMLAAGMEDPSESLPALPAPDQA